MIVNNTLFKNKTDLLSFIIKTIWILDLTLFIFIKPSAVAKHFVALSTNGVSTRTLFRFSSMYF